MIKKTNTPKVLDTFAIVHDPKSILSYLDDIYICLTVLEELDNLKDRRDKSVSSEDVAIDSQIADIDLLYTETQVFEGDLFDRLESDSGFKLSGEVYQLDRNLFNDDVQFNMYWYDEAGHIGLVTEVTTEHVFTKLLPRKQEKVWGISPKNPRQAIARTSSIMNIVTLAEAA